MDKLLDPGYLFDLNPGPPSDWYAIVAAIFAVVLLVAQGLYHFWAKSAFAQNAYLLRLARIVVMLAGAVSSVAILLVIARYLTLPFLSMRFLLLLTILVGIGLAAYFVYYMVKIFPMKTAMLARESIRQRYLPQQRPQRLPATIRQRKKGKRKKK